MYWEPFNTKCADLDCLVNLGWDLYIREVQLVVTNIVRIDLILEGDSSKDIGCRPTHSQLIVKYGLFSKKALAKLTPFLQ